MTKKYALTDKSGAVVNVILWDGVTPYDPGEELTLAEYAPDIHEQKRIKPIPEDDPPLTKLEKRLEALEKKVKP